MPRNNIVYIVNSLNLGGTENLVVQMSQAFQATFNISVICLDEPGIWADKLRDSGIPVYCFWRQPGLDLSMATKMAAFCKKHDIVLIHAHQCTAWFYSALSRIFYSKPKVIFEEHGRHYPEVYSWKKYCFNKTITQHLTYKTVAVSQDVKKRLVKYEGIAEERIDVVYNGVHPPAPITQEQRESLRQYFGLRSDDFVIGVIGRLDPIKNIPLLLKAVAETKKKCPDIKVLLVGDGPCLGILHELTETLQITEQVIFAGYRKDATDILQCIDLLALSSFSEGTSLALLESMAFGVPCLVTEVGGSPEVVTKNVSGWVIPSDNLEEMTSAIVDAYHNSKKRDLFGQEGQKRFLNFFTFDMMINHYRKLYLNSL